MTVLDRFSLAGQVAVVTGSGRGIGRGIAIGLAEAGADVIVTGRRTGEIDSVAAEIRATGRRGLAIAGDIRNADTADALATAAVEQLGRIDLWVNNAGGAEDRTMRLLAATPEAAWDDQLELNLKAAWLGARAAAARMTDGGCIVNISSIAAGRASANNGPYAAAKAGLNQLTKTLAAELAPQRIRVNAVSPGPVPTEAFLVALNLTEDQLGPVAAMIPMGRMGSPEDIAAAVVYLASPAAAWVTGANLAVDGGMG